MSAAVSILNIFCLLVKIATINAHYVKNSSAEIPPVFHLDNFDTCFDNFRENAVYCTAIFQVLPENPENSSESWDSIEKLSSNPKNYRHDWLRYGICLPSTCADEFISENSSFSQKTILKNCYDRKFQHQGLVVEVTKVHCQKYGENLYPIDVYDITVGSILGIYVIFVLAATLFDGIQNYQPSEIHSKTNDESIFGRILVCFSIAKNWTRLTTLSSNEPDLRLLRGIQGARFYNMICVILSHTVMSLAAAPIANTIFLETITEDAPKMFLANGGYAVQTYFLISGWLLTYHLYIHSETKTKIGVDVILIVFLRRFIRLTPALAVMVAINSTWLVHLGNGPFWDEIVGREYRNCRANWWTNILYVNNYVGKENMCMQQTWYTATDTQLFPLALIVVTLAIKLPKYAKLILVGIPTVIGIVIKFTVSYVNNYDIVVRVNPESLYNYLLEVPYWHVMYSSAYANITGYTVGMAFGYFFYKARKNKLKITKVHVCLWWILTFVPSLFVVLIAVQFYKEDYQHNRLLSSVYWGVGTTAYSISLAIAIFGFTQKIGWVVRWVCEWKPVQILGRLTFSAYLVHVSLIKVRVGMIRSPLFVTEFTIMHSAFGDVVVAYFVATALCILIEMPISALEKLIFKNRQNH